MMVVEPEALLRWINQRLQTDFVLVERYTAGEQGAYAIVDRAGQRFVLKWSADARDLDNYRVAAATASVLRTVDYPAPVYRYVGALQQGSYVIQDELPGRPMGVVSDAFLLPLLQLNGLQAGRAIPGPRDWPSRVVETVLVGGDGYCVLDSLRHYSQTTSELLSALQALVSARARNRFETNDIVHFDFQPSNILVDSGTISGVVDWEGSCAGDCTFDLATLLFYSYDVPELRRRLWRESLERAAPDALAVYLAHLILRQVDWSIRHHDRDTVDYFIIRARDVLRDIARVCKDGSSSFSAHD
jgi:aminoglycoside phosphotransferase (APT) family kinase protein